MSLRRLTRRPRHLALLWLLNALSALIRVTPLSVAQALGHMLGSLIGWVSVIIPSPRTQRSTRPAERLNCHGRGGSQALLRAAWGDLGRRAFEWLKGEEALQLICLSPSAQVWCDQLSGSSPPERVICLSAHLGHWELMASKLSRQGVEFISAASAERSGPVGQWVTAHRASLGVRTMRPQRGLAPLSSLLRKGGVRAFLIDLPSRGASSRVLPFLGSPAQVLTLPSRLIDRARRRGETTVLWVYSLREADGRYWVYIDDLSAEDDPVLAAHHKLEALVCQAPEQWLWMSDRWRDAR